MTLSPQADLADAFEVARQERIVAICADHDQLIIKALPKAEQIQVCEFILLTHPVRSVQLWARALYLDLTNPENVNASENHSRG